MMLGFLLARAGVDVYVLEKHKDFLRDFRGDTIHPSTLELMRELGFLDEFLRLPHQEVRELAAQIGNDVVLVGDFGHVPAHCKFLAMMPQWNFLNFIAEKGKEYPGFHLMMCAEVTEYVEANGIVSGVRAKTENGELEVRADLTVGADGRHSVSRDQAGLGVVDLGAPMDVMWMRISRLPDDPAQTFGHVEAGKILVMIEREKYWQCAYVIPKGTASAVREKGLPAFREEIAKLSPFLGDRVQELRDWNDVSLLTVAVDRLSRWSKPGFLCIGDAAHAMSPVGGVGINLAIQDAVAAANLLAASLRKGRPTEEELRKVQKRREFPTRATQQVQIFFQKKIIGKVLTAAKPASASWIMKLVGRVPLLRRIPARIVGVGFRPEHVRTPDIRRAA